MTQNEADQYVFDLKNHPEKRMKEIKLNDKVVFLKKDQENNELWNFGYGEILGITSKDGSQKNQLDIQNVQEVLLISPSFPFQIYALPEHLLRNYTDETRGVKNV